MQQSRKSSLQKNILKMQKRARKSAGTEPMLNGTAELEELQVLRKVPMRPPTQLTCPKEVCAQ